MTSIHEVLSHYLDRPYILRGKTLSGLEMLDGSKPPTQKQVDGWIKEYDKFIADNLYKKKREKEYPSIEDQLDMLWHAMDSKEIPVCSAFYNAIKVVKDANPKPN